MKNLELNIRFVIRTKSNGRNWIFTRISVDDKRTELSLKQEVISATFNPKLQQFVGKTKEDKLLNEFIDGVRFKFLKAKNELSLAQLKVTPENLKARYFGAPTEEEKKNHIEVPNVIAYYRQHNEKFKELIGIDISAATHTRHVTSADHLERFINEFMGQKDIPINEVTFHFLNEYAHYFKTIRLCNHNTTMKYIKNLGKIIRLALADGLIERNPFDKFKLTYKPVVREVLTAKELKKLRKLELDEGSRLDRVRDLFVFCCYTGLAFIDVMNLKMENMQKDDEGKLWVKNTRTKTSIEFMVPLLSPAKKIVKKYKNTPLREKEGKVLPTYSNQKYNSYLKDLASSAEITKPLTSHIARHTFATTVTLEEGVPLEVVSKMLGHTNTRTTQIYAKVNEAAILHGMKGILNKKKN